MFSKVVFYVGHLLFKPRALWFYFYLTSNECKDEVTVKSRQRKELVSFLEFCKKNVPYYKERIPQIELASTDFSRFMNGIPLLSKVDIFENRDEIELPENLVGKFKRVQTGGSTGNPLRYRLSDVCDDASFAILYRGHGRGGYRLGDKIAIMAGGSLIGKKKTFKSILSSWVMNNRKYSSYGVSDDLFAQYADDLAAWRPDFILGYVTAIYEFAKYVEGSGRSIKFKSVFTTAEMLFEHQRLFIERVFECRVYNGYGLNDGAITAFECALHDGFHIDLERGYLEVVNEDGEAVVDEVGRIVATSFLNKATPFVRYLTGDYGMISSRRCACGSPYPLLVNVMGRVTEAIKINGLLVGSPVLTVLMANTEAMRYQFIQVADDSMKVVIERSGKYGQKDEEFIRNSLFSQLGEFSICFEYDVEHFVMTDGGKHRIVINEVS
ncbi:hypothetical protein [Halopseudomonas sp.]|uniref:phenylacetate--CoA ligase family protein n=1 Tax=Halopseudomonas sp. TaxID=2901191 RepID=UPI00311D735D